MYVLSTHSLTHSLTNLQAGLLNARAAERLDVDRPVDVESGLVPGARPRVVLEGIKLQQEEEDRQELLRKHTQNTQQQQQHTQQQQQQPSNPFPSSSSSSSSAASAASSMFGQDTQIHQQRVQEAMRQPRYTHKKVELEDLLEVCACVNV
jgi:hypothetical protein